MIVRRKHAPAGIGVVQQILLRRRVDVLAGLPTRGLLAFAREHDDVVFVQVFLGVPQSLAGLDRSLCRSRSVPSAVDVNVAAASEPATYSLAETPMRSGKHSEESVPPVEIAMFGNEPSLELAGRRRSGTTFC